MLNVNILLMFTCSYYYNTCITNYTRILNVFRLTTNMQFGVISQMPNTNTYIVTTI